ncbi:MAG TPA: ROK family transcriptional regulator [Jatrophihabitans sp.]
MSFPVQPAGQQTVRQHNLALVLAELRRSPGSRAHLAQRTGLTKATVASLVDSLVAQGILDEAEPASSGPGRPARALALDPSGPIGLGIEINVDYLAAGVVDLTGRLRGHRHLPADNRSWPVAKIYAEAVAMAQELLADIGQPLLGVGVAVPAAVNGAGEVVRAPNLPRLAGQRPAEQLAAALSVDDVLVENEANLGALARLWAAPAAGRDFVYVSGEIGVGAGVVVDGRLFRGVHGFAGELGHVVIERNGPPCGCGGRGCLEQYAGQDVLVRTAGQPDLAGLEAAVHRADRRALHAVEQAGAALGVGLSSLLNVLDLPMVVLGGLYSRLFEAITPALTSELSTRVLSSRQASGQVRRSSLGIDAAVRGAAGLIVDRALTEPDRLLAAAAPIDRVSASSGS